MKREKDGTLIELLVIILFILAIVLLVLGAVFRANVYVTRDGVLETIQKDHPEAVKVLDVHRKVFRYSDIEIENQDGTRSLYKLDTSILFNYEVVEKVE